MGRQHSGAHFCPLCSYDPFEEMADEISGTIERMLSNAKSPACAMVTLREPWVPDLDMFPHCTTKVDQAKMESTYEQYLEHKRETAMERGPFWVREPAAHSLSMTGELIDLAIEPDLF